MNIIEKIESLSTTDRKLIADGIKNNFPTITEGDGRVVVSSEREFNLYRELLSLIEHPLEAFWEKHNIPLTVIDSQGVECPSNVNDAILYLLSPDNINY